MTGNDSKLIFQEWLNAYGDHLQRLAKPGVVEAITNAGTSASQGAMPQPQMGHEGGLELK